MQIVERWILARLRHQTFFSLAELNQCIRALLNELNERPFKQLPGNRREAFEQLDRPALGSLPVHPYRYVAIKTVKVNIDYHVSYEQHHYSVRCRTSMWVSNWSSMRAIPRFRSITSNSWSRAIRVKPSRG